MERAASLGGLETPFRVLADLRRALGRVVLVARLSGAAFFRRVALSSLLPGVPGKLALMRFALANSASATSFVFAPRSGVSVDRVGSGVSIARNGRSLARFCQRGIRGLDRSLLRLEYRALRFST